MHQLVLLSILLGTCLADVYMHNPRGSNDRNCEKDVNRQNANRLFDSQNNAKGGYACPYPANNQMYYYAGSKLKIEWTAQHGCGGSRNKCDIILQYMCSDDNDAGVRDGLPIKPNNDAGTERIPEDAKASRDPAYGMHESYEYYIGLKDTSRNKGLFIADRNLGNGEGGATRTRQNNNGNRHGFEVPEERDYYPYWFSSPWIDIAILTDDKRRCGWLQSESENVKSRGYCMKPNPLPKYKAGTWPNNPADCGKLGASWVTSPPRNLAAPFCDSIPGASRENQLGNVGADLSAMHYDWVIPKEAVGKRCVTRIRYNISWTDYENQPPAKFLDHTYNKNSTIQTDPYVKVAGKHLSLKVNTNQIGRVFQDRSYVFKVREWPKDVPASAAIHNLNVRGKRGNIVQTFPAVEYDFIPNRLGVKKDDYIHFQWVGSDYNPRRGPNDAEGGPPTAGENVNDNARADRSNLVECRPNGPTASARMIPYTNATELARATMFVTSDAKPDTNKINLLAYLRQPTGNQGKCLTWAEIDGAKNKRETERAPNNCAKINTPSPYFDGGLTCMRKIGTFPYMCSRNNNFSNRNQQGVIIVGNTSKRFAEQVTDDEIEREVLAASDPTSIDNPIIDETKVDERAAELLPEQTNENDNVGEGQLVYQNLDQTTAVFTAMGVPLPTTGGKMRRSVVAQPSESDLTSVDLSSQSVAGLAVGCAFGGVLVGAVLAIVFYKP